MGKRHKKKGKKSGNQVNGNSGPKNAKRTNHRPKPSAKSRNPHMSMSQEALITSKRGFDNSAIYRRLPIEFIKSEELFELNDDIAKLVQKETSEVINEKITNKQMDNDFVDEKIEVSCSNSDVSEMNEPIGPERTRTPVTTDSSTAETTGDLVDNDGSSINDKSDISSSDSDESSDDSIGGLVQLKNLALRDIGGTDIYNPKESESEELSDLPDGSSDDSVSSDVSDSSSDDLDESSDSDSSSVDSSEWQTMSDDSGSIKSLSISDQEILDELHDYAANTVLEFVHEILAVQYRDDDKYLLIDWYDHAPPRETDEPFISIEEFYDYFRSLLASDHEISRGLKYLGYESDEDSSQDELDKLIREFEESDDEEIYNEYDLDTYDSDDGLGDLVEKAENWRKSRNFDYLGQTTKTQSNRKGKMPDFGVQGELRDYLEAQWLKSREAKKMKKIERQNLRQQGKLSRRGKKPKNPAIYDVFDIYLEEITIYQVIEELNHFKDNEAQAMFFPPLDKNANWIIKQICQAYQLKAETRAGCILASKTKNTYDFVDMDIVEKFLKRRKTFPRTDRIGKRMTDRSSHRSRESNGPRMFFSEGEIVGQAAEELADDNIGRQLLVKMGWSQGMGLGTANIGIKEPILAKMKKTKVGLGA